MNSLNNMGRLTTLLMMLCFPCSMIAEEKVELRTDGGTRYYMFDGYVQPWCYVISGSDGETGRASEYEFGGGYLFLEMDACWAMIYSELDKKDNYELILAIDPTKIIKKREYYEAWAKREYYTDAHRFEFLGEVVYSCVELVRVSADKRQYRTIQSVYYGKDDELIYFDKSPSEWFYIVPNTQCEIIADKIVSIYDEMQEAQRNLNEIDDFNNH